MDSKETIASAMLQVYHQQFEAKPSLDGILKQENKKRRKDFICPTCKVDQLTDAAFHAHLKIHPLECLTCGKCFFRRANLALHVKTHLGIKNYKWVVHVRPFQGFIACFIHTYNYLHIDWFFFLKVNRNFNVVWIEPTPLGYHPSTLITVHSY